MFDGVRTSLIYPLLEQDNVVWRIVKAVQQDEEHVVIPWSMGMLIPLANMHPVHVKDFLGWFLILPGCAVIGVGSLLFAFLQFEGRREAKRAWLPHLDDTGGG